MNMVLVTLKLTSLANIPLQVIISKSKILNKILSLLLTKSRMKFWHHVQIISLLKPLRKIPLFHLISECGNCAERNSFCRVSGASPNFSPVIQQNCHAGVLGQITVFLCSELVLVLTLLCLVSTKMSSILKQSLIKTFT